MANMIDHRERKVGVPVVALIITLIFVALLTILSPRVGIFPSNRGIKTLISNETKSSSNLEELILSKVDPLAVREFTVKLTTDPLNAFPNLWNRYTIVDEDRFLEKDYYWYIKIRLSTLEGINGSIESNTPIDFYVVDEENFLRFKGRESFYYYTKPSRINIYRSSFEWKAPSDGTYYLIVYAKYGNARVRLKADVFTKPLLRGFPYNIRDREAWYIWIINVWVVKNIHYIPDPNFELIQEPEQTLKLRAGDCDDVAVLMASMYQAVGLRTKFAEVDTDGDGKIDHMTVLVYYHGTPKEFLDSEETIAFIAGLISRLPDKLSVSYIKDSDGIWIIADPLFSENDYCVGMIEHEPYKIKNTIPYL